MQTPSSKIQITVKRPQSISLKINRILSTTPRMLKRSKLPPRLNLEPKTPPATKRNSVYRLDSPTLFLSQLAHSPRSFGDSFMNAVSPLFEKGKRTRRHRHQNDQMCCICEDPVSSKLKSEKIIETDCSHQAHYNCYLLMIDKDDLDEYPICSICCQPCKPIHDDILLELHSQTLIGDDPILSTKELLDFSPIIPEPDLDYSPLISESILNYSLPDNDTLSDFKSEFNFKTPADLDQTLTNSDPNGFNIKIHHDLENISPFSFSTPSTDTIGTCSRFSSIDYSNSMDKYNADDLFKPNINVITEFNKHVINENIENYPIETLVNVFTNELDEDETKSFNEDMKLKEEINVFIKALLIKEIKDSKNIKFENLPFLQMFDYIEISIDGNNWEFVHGFIFKDILILINEGFDSIVGNIQLKEHFANLIKINDETLQLYFTSTTLPELLIKSSNKILIRKWEDYFQFKLQKSSAINSEIIPLIQMSTNLWEMITESNYSIKNDIKIPTEIITFNSLTHKGLDLPINIMKSIIPKPQDLHLNLILAIQLINYTDLSNEVYLSKIKTIIKTTLESIDENDRIGLILIGRNGLRKKSLFKNSFIGMVNSKWDGWSSYLEDLKVFDDKDYEIKINKSKNFIKVVKSINTLISTIPDLNYELRNQDNDDDDDEQPVDSIKRVLMVNNGWKLEDFDLKKLRKDPEVKKLLDFNNFTLQDIVINSNYDSFNEGLIDNFNNFNGVFKSFKFERFQTFDKFNNLLPNMIKKLKRIYLPNFNLKFELQMTNYLKFKDHDEDVDSIEIKLKDLYDGFYTNLPINLELNVSKLIQSFKEKILPKNDETTFELPTFKIKYSYLDKVYVKEFSTKISINESLLISKSDKFLELDYFNSKHVDSEVMKTPIESQMIINNNRRSKLYIDIPLLPPMSSFKDSIFVKHQLEQLIMKTLRDCIDNQETRITIKELITKMFGMIRGCSTNFIDFYKQSEFKKYNNFINYINELIRKLNKLNDNKVLMKDMLYSLILEEDI